MAQGEPAKLPAATNGGLAAVCALTALAGCVDAQVVLHGAELLPVYVTGDTTKLAAALAAGAWARAWPPVAVVLLFLAGSVLAARLGRAGGRARAIPPLLCGLLLLLGALPAFLGAEGPPTLAALLPIAAAMGAVNQVVPDDPGVTFITGTLVRASRAIAAGELAKAGRDLLRWASFLVGAGAGALLHAAAGRQALAVPAAAILLAGLVLALRPIHDASPKEA